MDYVALLSIRSPVTGAERDAALVRRVSPAVSAEDGLRIGPEVFGRLNRLQP